MKATVTQRLAFAACRAAITFGLLPDVEMPMTTSPSSASASICRAKMLSKPKSFAPAVRIEVSVLSAIAGSAWRFRR